MKVDIHKLGKIPHPKWMINNYITSNETLHDYINWENKESSIDPK